ncbi:unnamed protein product [Rhodiola kirilowii]
MEYALRFLNDGKTLERELNESLITLVPKTKNPVTFDEYRPISLCNVAMKVITKTLANRLKEALNDCVSETQSAFVPGRLITDNILIAHEFINHMRTRADNSAGYCCIKVDMSKAYDRVEWGFLEDIQRRMGFPDTWIKKIMFCVRSVSYKIRINDIISDSFLPERGIRQGDPLSPYLFVLCMEWLARRLERAQQQGEIQGIKVSRYAPAISHLLFTDDCIVFVRADVDNVLRLKSILKEFETISGQRINFSKSQVYVGNNVEDGLARAFVSILGMNVVDGMDKYLGLPVCFKGRKSRLLNYIEDRMWKRVHGWKEKLLSVAGKEVLIKSVVQAIPIYALSCFKMPNKVFERWNSIVSSFWWNNAKEGRYIAWLDRMTMQSSKEDGGLGLRNFKLQDISTRQVCWKHKWGYRASWAWRSIQEGIQYLNKWQLGRGEAMEHHNLLFSNGGLSTKAAYALLLQEEIKKVADVKGEVYNRGIAVLEGNSGRSSGE